MLQGNEEQKQRYSVEDRDFPYSAPEGPTAFLINNSLSLTVIPGCTCT